MMKLSGVEKVMNVRDRKRNARLVEEHGADLHAYLTRRLRSKDGASDLAQEVFVRFMRIDRSEWVRKPAAYLTQIANQVVAEFRLQQSRIPVDGSDVLEKAEADGKLLADIDLLEAEHAKRELQRLLPKLSSDHRTVFLLRKRDGFSTHEIAKIMRISHYKVKRYLVQANAKLDEELREGRR
jgi:RNA polymerase sigma factor (sigma-70 family)